MRQRSRQCMERAALIVLIESTVVVISSGLGHCDCRRNMQMRSDGRGLVQINGVVVKQRENARDLRGHEQDRQQRSDASGCPATNHANHPPAVYVTGRQTLRQRRHSASICYAHQHGRLAAGV